MPAVHKGVSSQQISAKGIGLHRCWVGILETLVVVQRHLALACTHGPCNSGREREEHLCLHGAQEAVTLQWQSSLV